MNIFALSGCPKGWVGGNCAQLKYMFCIPICIDSYVYMYMEKHNKTFLYHFGSSLGTIALRNFHFPTRPTLGVTHPRLY